MSDAAVKVDPDFYNQRLLETEPSVDQSRRAFPASAASAGGRGAGGGFGMLGGAGRDGGGGGGYGAPDLPDYLVRQHSLLGLYLSLNPGDEGAFVVSQSTKNESRSRKQSVRIYFGCAWNIQTQRREEGAVCATQKTEEYHIDSML